MNVQAKESVAVTANNLAVVRVDGHYRVLATRAFRPGDLLHVMEGELRRRPSRYTVQVAQNLHLDLPAEATLETILDRYYWRFLNHSCAPNAIIRGQKLEAIKVIQPWEQIAFDYNSTEYEMAEPFDCSCGADDCEGLIRGYRFLDASGRSVRHDRTARHLLELNSEAQP